MIQLQLQFLLILLIFINFKPSRVFGQNNVGSDHDASPIGVEEPPSMEHVYDPNGPLVYCSYLPLEFLNCSAPEDLKGNISRLNELGHGCVQWGGERFEDVQKTSVWCTALPGIECYGNRTFLKPGFPCIMYNGHYFVTTLIYSVLLGFLGMDRFCLGHTGTAVGKLLTLGGVGVWWIIDVVLLVTGQLKPADKSNWVPYY